MDYDKAIAILKRERIRVNGLSLTIEVESSLSYTDDVYEAIRYLTEQKGFEVIQPYHTGL